MGEPCAVGDRRPAPAVVFGRVAVEAFGSNAGLLTALQAAVMLATALLARRVAVAMSHRVAMISADVLRAGVLLGWSGLLLLARLLSAELVCKALGIGRANAGHHGGHSAPDRPGAGHDRRRRARLCGGEPGRAAVYTAGLADPFFCFGGCPHGDGMRPCRVAGERSRALAILRRVSDQTGLNRTLWGDHEYSDEFVAFWSRAC